MLPRSRSSAPALLPCSRQRAPKPIDPADIRVIDGDTIAILNPSFGLPRLLDFKPCRSGWVHRRWVHVIAG
jgi:hypothetical protein